MQTKQPYSKKGRGIGQLFFSRSGYFRGKMNCGATKRRFRTFVVSGKAPEFEKYPGV